MLPVRIKNLFPSQYQSFHLLLISIPINFLIDIGNSVPVLSSPIITNLGNWGPVQKCNGDRYVVGMQLKVESIQNDDTNDNTAVNGIRFFCGRLGEKLEIQDAGKETGMKEAVNSKYKLGYVIDNNIQWVQSYTGPWGEWRKAQYCDNYGVVVGFQVNSQSPQGNRDDSGMTNLKLFCSGEKSEIEVIEGDGMDWGIWSDVHKCSNSQAICGIQTQVHVSIQDPNLKNCWYRESNGSIDQLGLTNIKVECCQIPNPAQICHPIEKWELLIECEYSDIEKLPNEKGICEHEKNIGISYSHNESSFTVRDVQIMENLGFNLYSVSTKLFSNFEINISSHEDTQYSWSESEFSAIWKVENEATDIHKELFSFEVPLGYKVQVFQLVGICGFYVVKTNRYRRIFTEYESRRTFIAEEYPNVTFSYPDDLILHKLNDSFLSELDESDDDLGSTMFLVYLLIGVVGGTILTILLVSVVYRMCKYYRMDEELTAESERIHSTASSPCGRAKNRLGLEMERF